MRVAKRLGEERGSAGLHFVIVVAAVLALAGLVSDGAGKARAARTVNLVAAEAARTGAQAVAAGVIAGQAARVDTGAGSAAARSYLSAAGMDGTVRVSGTQVSVTTHTRWAPTFYSFVPAQTLTATATSSIESR